MRVRLVGYRQVNFRDGGSLNEPLDAMSRGVGTDADVAAFEGIHEFRDEVGADQVSLLRVFEGSSSTQGVCGLAWLMQSLNPFWAQRAFSVVQVGSFTDSFGRTSGCPDLVLAHELAHNWGSAHNEGDNGIFSYSVGHAFAPYKSIMSGRFNGETTVPHYSNPDISHEGHTTGNERRNNALSINQVRETVANFRPTKIFPPKLDASAPINKTTKNFINNGDKRTKNRNVTLRIAASDNTAVTAYHISENKDKPSPDRAAWTAIVAPSLSFEMEVPYKLSKGVGRKRVFVRFMDAAGNVSNMRDDRIMFRRK